jgi:hypothetical protein
LSSVSDKYQPLDDTEFLAILRRLIQEFQHYLHNSLGYNEDQYFISEIDLIDIIIRVHKRLAYFRYFHNMRINDRKKAALFAYWVIKLRPVKIIDNGLKNQIEHIKVNEKLALNHLLLVLVKRGRIKLWDGKDGAKVDGENEFIKELVYSFRFRNFSIDSMIVLADAICTQSFL